MKSKNQLVSVIIPVYNCEKYVAEAINSVLAQDYPNKEIILINDGSTDKTLSILKSFGKKIVIINKKINEGIASAKNDGIKRAKGDYVAILDADDLWLPGKLSLQIKYLEAHPDVGAVYGSIKSLFPDRAGKFTLPKTSKINNNDFEIIKDKSGWAYHKLLVESLVCPITLVIRKSIINKVGFFDKQFYYGDDRDYMIRMSRICKIDKLKQVLALVRMTPGSATRGKPRNRHEEYFILNKAIKVWGLIGPDGSEVSKKEFNMKLALSAYEFASNHLRRGSPLIATNYFFRSIVHRPFSPKVWFFLFFSIINLFLIPLKIKILASRIDDEIKK